MKSPCEVWNLTRNISGTTALGGGFWQAVALSASSATIVKRMRRSLLFFDFALHLDGDAALDAFRHRAARIVMLQRTLGGGALVFWNLEAILHGYVGEEQLAVDFLHAPLDVGFEFFGVGPKAAPLQCARQR